MLEPRLNLIGKNPTDKFPSTVSMQSLKCNLLSMRNVIYGPSVKCAKFAFQTIQYITRSKVIETETRELSSISRGKIKFGETDDWKNEKLFVPPLPPTNLRGCHLIRIQYDVFVSIFSYIGRA